LVGGGQRGGRQSGGKRRGGGGLAAAVAGGVRNGEVKREQCVWVKELAQQEKDERGLGRSSGEVVEAFA
jgi:hypothetical protein